MQWCVFLGRDRQRQNAESPSRERQRSRWKRKGPVGRPSSGGGSGLAWLSAAPIRNSRSMVISGWGVTQVGGYRPQFRPHRGVIYLVQHGDQFLSRLSVVRGARVSDRHLLVDHTPMQPGAGGGTRASGGLAGFVLTTQDLNHHRYRAVIAKLALALVVQPARSRSQHSA